MIATAQEFNYNIIRNAPTQTKPRGNNGGRHKRVYKDLICAFDIETTRLKDTEQSIMYIWQAQIDDYYTVIGRTWEDFKYFTQSIAAQLKPNENIVFYVHNLSYEFQFLRGIYEFSPEAVFAVEKRKVLKCVMHDCIEFRCSYLHSNMKLSEYVAKMGAKHRKLDGKQFDYNKIRYPWTPLSDYELQYCINDVLALVEALKIEMKHDDDNLYTIPLTSTGYVRRDTKAAMRTVNRAYIIDQLPDYEIYKALREAFRGGNTHANRFYTGQILNDVHSADRSSSYPDVQCNCKFPISPFHIIDPVPEWEYLIKLMTVHHKALIIRAALHNVELREWWWGCPYLSRDKCRNIVNGEYDNGRILGADYLETTLTDIDLRIVTEEYNFTSEILWAAYARYGILPAPMRETAIAYYKAKTELKGVDGQELYYIKSKNKLNSIYGMSAQDPIKQSIEFKNGEFIERTDDPEELLSKSNKNAFLPYQWGVWTTALARLRLEDGIKLAGRDFVYADTDSVKYLGVIDWTKYNRKRILDSKQSGAYATDPKGTTHYMGVYEPEHDMKEFCTLGAKKYVYRENGGKLKITIAGVTKSEGGAELEAAGGIEAFKPGFTFYRAGGTEAVYNDNPELPPLEIDGHKLEITSNVVIRESTYTLGITAEYDELLKNSAESFKFIVDNKRGLW